MSGDEVGGGVVRGAYSFYFRFVRFSGSRSVGLSR